MHAAPPPPHASAPSPGAGSAAHDVRPPARRARRAALSLSLVAVAFMIAFGFALRSALSFEPMSEDYLIGMIGALSLLLVALLVRMAAAVCELLWLERTWSNLPEDLRNVGPVEKASTGMVLGLSVIPVVAYVWKLGLVLSLADGFERVRARVPFETRIPKRLGVAAVVVGWVPGLNVYVAPFLWEIFATRIDVACTEILAARAAAVPLPTRTAA